MPANALAAVPPDGRQSQTALAVARGTTRLLHQFGFSGLSELPLPSGRRADLVVAPRVLNLTALVVDPDDRIPEADEANNRATTPPTLAPPCTAGPPRGPTPRPTPLPVVPDLAGQATAHQTGGCYREGQPIVWSTRLRVDNLGGADAAAFEARGSSGSWRFAGLPAGASLYAVDAVNGAPVVLDPEDRIRERNEGNNVLEVPPLTAVPCPPDATSTSMPTATTVATTTPTPTPRTTPGPSPSTVSPTRTLTTPAGRWVVVLPWSERS